MKLTKKQHAKLSAAQKQPTKKVTSKLVAKKSSSSSGCTWG